MSQNFIISKLNLDFLNIVLLHVVYTVVIIIVGQSFMIIYQKLWSLERTLDRAGVLGLFPPRGRT